MEYEWKEYLGNINNVNKRYQQAADLSAFQSEAKLDYEQDSILFEVPILQPLLPLLAHPWKNMSR